MSKTNTDEDKCRYCNQRTEALFMGRNRICRNPDCPADKGADWVDDDPTDPHGFTIRDPDDDDRKKLDLEIIELDIDGDWT